MIILISIIRIQCENGCEALRAVPITVPPRTEDATAILGTSKEKDISSTLAVY